MTKEELLSLADRVEKAEGADRELDADIALTLGIVHERDGDCFYGHRDFSVMVLERGYYDHDGGAPELPAYTSSIDAAMTLVPEGLGGEPLHIRIERPNAGNGIVDGRCSLLDTLGGQESFAEASTPALALTAAALRAHASTIDDQTKAA